MLRSWICFAALVFVIVAAYVVPEYVDRVRSGSATHHAKVMAN